MLCSMMNPSIYFQSSKTKEMKLNNLADLSILLEAEVKAEAKAKAIKEAENKKKEAINKAYELAAKKAADDRKAQMNWLWTLNY